MKRVVITSMGAVTPIGNNVVEFWDGIKSKKCGIDEITLFDTTKHKVHLAGEVKNLEVEKLLTPKERKRLDRFSQFAMIASRELMENSKLDMEKVDRTRFGVFVSTGIGGLDTIATNAVNCNNIGPEKVSPFFIPTAIVNMAAGNIAIDLGIYGESASIVTACASATHSIGEAYRTIKHGYQDLMIAGGTDATIDPLGISGFANIKALSTETDKTKVSIPFDKNRSGFAMGEGAGLILLEDYEHAKKRGANILAEIVGYSATTDGIHITSPDAEAKAATRAMRNCFDEANLEENIGNGSIYINAHGTSTPLNDKCESLAINNLIKTIKDESVKEKVYVSSTKGYTGHLLGAAGGIEAVICVKALSEDLMPSNLGCKEIDEECNVNVILDDVKNENLKYAMSNSLGFGGHNSTILLKKYEG